MAVHSEGEGLGCTFTLDIPATLEPQNVETNTDIEDGPFYQDGNVSQRSVISPTPMNIFSRKVQSFISPVAIDEAWMLSAIGRESHEEVKLDRYMKSSTSTNDMNVLIVDDAQLNRKMLCRLIRSSFGSIEEAEDGQMALDMVRESLRQKDGTPPDVILIDYIMPNMDGPTATRAIRALGFKGLIIGVTGNALPADVETFMSCGADKVLIKPLRVDALLNAISELARL